MFVDRIKTHISAGKGGNGVVAWRREKYIPKGGPSGGNGGKGGSVIVRADTQVPSLDWYRNRKHLRAEDGGVGGSNLRQGKNGKDLLLTVPCGTLIKNAETGDVIADLTEDKQEIILCQGGKGGRGNDSFKSPTNRAPTQYTLGKPGHSLTVEFELKLIADVGFVGFPNAGKSTLMTALTRVKVKAAPYPFTTLKPNLGFFPLPDTTRVYLADIPGIIEGAHRNRGLGHEFLRHIERTKLLIFILDASGIDGRNPADDYKVLRAELKAYDPELLKKPFLVVLNKIDDEAAIENIKTFKKKYKIASKKLFLISALQGEGLPALIEGIIENV